MLIAPEIVLYNTITATLAFVRADYDAAIGKDTSFLASILKGLKIGKYDYYEQAVAIFMRPEQDSRYLDVNMFFNFGRAAIPTIHINLPGESLNANGIGFDRGWAPSIFNAALGQEYETYTRRYEGQYQAVVTSSNPIEVAVIYRVLKALLTIAFKHLEFSGLENMRMSGYDLQIGEPQATQFFSRALRIGLEHEESVRDLFPESLILKLQAIGTPSKP